MKLTSEGSTGNILAKLLISMPILSSMPFTPTQVFKDQESKLGLVFFVSHQGFVLHLILDKGSNKETEADLRGRAIVSAFASQAGERRK